MARADTNTERDLKALRDKIRGFQKGLNGLVVTLSRHIGKLKWDRTHKATIKAKRRRK